MLPDVLCYETQHLNILISKCSKPDIFIMPNFVIHLLRSHQEITWITITVTANSCLESSLCVRALC